MQPSILNATRHTESSNISRNRGKLRRSVTQPTLAIAIDSDILTGVQELKYKTNNIPNATYAEIDSVYGHDGVLVEVETITKDLRKWMGDQKKIGL